MKFSVYSGTYYIEGHNTYMLPWSKVPFSASLLDFTRGSPNGRVSHMFAPGRQNAWRLFQIICPLFKIPSDFARIHYSLSYSRVLISFAFCFLFYFWKYIFKVFLPQLNFTITHSDYIFFCSFYTFLIWPYYWSIQSIHFYQFSTS